MIREGYFYCHSKCPTGLSGDQCEIGTLETVFEVKFNTFADKWYSNNLTLTSTNTEPAKNRGNYFSDDLSSIMSFTKFYMAISCTVSTWIRLDDLENIQYIFSKDNNDNSNNRQGLNFAVDTDGRLRIFISDTYIGIY